MFVANFSIDDLLRGKYQKLVKKMIDTLVLVGEKCVTEAKNNGSYQDQTGNLRNSIGYVVLYNGVVQSQFVKNEHSKKLLEELIPKYSEGLVLIVVAGMNYATYVEAKNYNVLTSAELLAEQEVPKMLRQLGFK